MRASWAAGFLVAALFALSAIPAHAEVFPVATASDAEDETPGDGACATAALVPVCTLRAAVEEAGELPGADEVVIDAGLAIVSLTEGELAVSGADPLLIRTSGGPVEVRQDSAGEARVLLVEAPSAVELRDLALSGGDVSAGSAAEGGAGIRNEGELRLERVDVHGNVLSSGLACFSCALGAGIHSAAGAQLSVADSEVHANRAEELGAGGIYSAGVITLERSTIAGNEAEDDAGLLVRSAVANLVNVTIAGNIAEGDCGGARLDSPVVSTSMAIERSTIASNSEPGLCASGAGAGLRLSGTVLTGGPTNCVASTGAPAPDSDGHNVESGSACGLTATGDRSNTAPQLGPLAENGGPVRTLAPLPGSPLLEAGGPCPPPSTDARGMARPQGLACDAGAVEAARASDLSVTGSDSRDPVAAGAPTAHSFTVANAGPDAAGGVVASFELPAAADLAAVPAGCTAAAATTLTCPIGVLQPGASRGIQLELRRRTPGTIQSRGAVSSNPTDPNPANDAAQVTSTAAAVRAVVSVRRRQRVLRQRGIVLRLSSALAGTASARARVSIGAAARRFTFRRARARLAAGRQRRMKLRAPPRLLRAARLAFARGERLSARVTVNFAAQGEDAQPKRYRIRLVR